MKRLRATVALLAEFRKVSSLLHTHNPADFITGEESKLRLLILKIYARFEVQLLKVFWFIFKTPLMKVDITRKLMYYSLAKFMAEMAIVGQPMTLQQAENFIRNMPEDSQVALGPCRCRLAIGHRAGCSHPLMTDMVIATGVPIWLDVFPEDYHVINREEAVQLMRDARAEGLIQIVDRHLYYRGSANYFVLCNCCKEACLPIVGYRKFKRENMKFIPSPSVVSHDVALCRGCGTCVELCPFEERALESGRSVTLNCQGCGLCVDHCENKALSMVSRMQG